VLTSNENEYHNILQRMNFVAMEFRRAKKHMATMKPEFRKEYVKVVGDDVAKWKQAFILAQLQETRLMLGE